MEWYGEKSLYHFFFCSLMKIFIIPFSGFGMDCLCKQCYKDVVHFSENL